MSDRWSTTSPGSRQYTAQTDGVATITLSTSDGYPGREGVTQAYEFVVVTVNGTPVGRTSDLADRVASASDVTTLTVAVRAGDVITVGHSSLYGYSDGTQNSLEVVASFSVTPTPTTTSSTTTVPVTTSPATPTTTASTAAPSTSVDASTTTVDVGPPPTPSASAPPTVVTFVTFPRPNSTPTPVVVTDVPSALPETGLADVISDVGLTALLLGALLALKARRTPLLKGIRW